MEYFKQDILNLIHSLRIHRWKQVEVSMAGDLVVERISGALTNAVYSVSPPPYVKEAIKRAVAAEGSSLGRSYHHRVPNRLLLRVYGPQVEHLIDRKSELETIARLSVRNIGPKLLGTFTNGRFEQFLNARPLTKQDLRRPEISVLIAKRMRELHDGVKLLDEERKLGPGVWLNIDKWLPTAIDKLEALERKKPGAIEQVIQADIKTFKGTISRYKKWVTHRQGGNETISKKLVFCHNDVRSCLFRLLSR
jgi:choline kinase